jgi:hypothetical protein
MGLVVYLDESGDLGWNFRAPFRQGGSSRFLTIASVSTPSQKKHLPKRTIKKLYEKFGWNPSVEKKWSDMDDTERFDFATTASLLCRKHPEIHIHAITVKKESVQEHIRADGNKLYNYMIRLLLLEPMSKHNAVCLIPDPRSIKVESGNSLPDYLQICLWFESRCQTRLIFQPLESHSCINLQFADMLSGAIQTAFEDGNYKYYQALSPFLSQKRLYFS